MTARRQRSFRGAIVGFGNVAVEGHVPAWRQDRRFSIVAVCDASEARLAVAAEQLPDARRYGTLDELLAAEKLDFVDVATPPASHAEIVLAVLARRVHALCEKPLTTRPSDCVQIRSAASSARGLVFTAHNWKYAPIFRTAKRTLRRGDVGRVTHVRLETVRTTPPSDADATGTWRLDPALAGGGILVDHGWHAFYLAQHLADAEPIAITAKTEQRKFASAGVEDTAECTIEFPAARADIVLTWAGETRRNAALITGELGRLAIEDRTLVTTIGDRAPTSTAFAQALSAGSYHPDWFAAMLDDFHQEMQAPTGRGGNFREAELCCRLLDAGYRSSAGGGVRVALDEPAPPRAEPAGSA